MSPSEKNNLERLGLTDTARLVSIVDSWLESKFPSFFSRERQTSEHPILELKPKKVIHDNIWGTNIYEWQELAIIDSPVLQRLRRIQQTSLAYYTYPSLRHTRFEHTLGVVVAATRMFDAVLAATRDEAADDSQSGPGQWIRARLENDRDRWRREVRLAALLHDTGHSLFSHTSEPHYEALEPVARAKTELEDKLRKKVGAGEVLSFAIASSMRLREYIDRAATLVPAEIRHWGQGIKWMNVSLMILGRARSAELQFLADIVSSGLDADKLDYLRRDGEAAGLSLAYDVDRLLYSLRVRERKWKFREADETKTAGARLEKEERSKDIAALQEFYAQLARIHNPSKQAGEGDWDGQQYRLSIRSSGIGAVEQIVSCRMMLLGSVYHHRKVRAADGFLSAILEAVIAEMTHVESEDEEKTEKMKRGKRVEEVVLKTFLELDDWHLWRLAEGVESEEARKILEEAIGMLASRVLPRCVIELKGGEMSQDDVVKEFWMNIAGQPDKRKRLEKEILEELAKITKQGGRALHLIRAQQGVWIDVPSIPSGEQPVDMIEQEDSNAGTVPLNQWIEEYRRARLPIRIFAHSHVYEKEIRDACRTVLGRAEWLKSEEAVERVFVRR